MDSRDSWRWRGSQGVDVEPPGNAMRVRMKGPELSPRGRHDWKGRDSGEDNKIMSTFGNQKVSSTHTVHTVV